MITSAYLERVTLLPSEYFVNSTIEELVYDLMIEEWDALSIFERYCNECQPIP
jgi:hypothetical protein